MAINKKLIHFKSKEQFNIELANGNILDTSIVFIKETKEVWTHGQLYNCSGFDASGIIANIENLTSEVQENESVTSAAISDLYSKIGGGSASGSGIQIVSNVSELDPNAELGSVACVAQEGSGMSWTSLRNLYHTPSDGDLSQIIKNLSLVKDIQFSNSTNVPVGEYQVLFVNASAVESFGSENPDGKSICILEYSYEDGSGGIMGIYAQTEGNSEEYIILAYCNNGEMVFDDTSVSTFRYWLKTDRFYFLQCIDENGEQANPSSDIYNTIDQNISVYGGQETITDVYIKNDEWGKLDSNIIERIDSVEKHLTDTMSKRTHVIDISDTSISNIDKYNGVMSALYQEISNFAVFYNGGFSPAHIKFMGGDMVISCLISTESEDAVLRLVLNGENENNAAAYITKISSDSYVKCIEQSLTDEQKEQARANIGAISANDVKQAYPMVNHGTSDTSYAITPNVYHIWGEVTSLSLTYGTPIDGFANEYLFQFTSGATATTLSLPDTVKWANDNVISIESGKTYSISIVNNLALFASFTN